MTYDQIPYDSRLPYEPRRVTMDDISDFEIDYHVDHFRQCYVVDDRVLSMRTSIPYDDTWPVWRGDKFLKQSMIHMRYRLIADYQEAFWPMYQDEALPLLGGNLAIKVVSLFNLIVRNSPFFGSSYFWGDVGEWKYNESVDFMLQNPEATYDTYELDFTIKGKALVYDEELFGKVRHFLSPMACQIFTSERWR